MKSILLKSSKSLSLRKNIYFVKKLAKSQFFIEISFLFKNIINIINLIFLKFYF